MCLRLYVHLRSTHSKLLFITTLDSEVCTRPSKHFVVYLFSISEIFKLRRRLRIECHRGKVPASCVLLSSKLRTTVLHKILILPLMLNIKHSMHSQLFTLFSSSFVWQVLDSTHPHWYCFASVGIIYRLIVAQDSHCTSPSFKDLISTQLHNKCLHFQLNYHKIFLQAPKILFPSLPVCVFCCQWQWRICL